MVTREQAKHLGFQKTQTMSLEICTISHYGFYFILVLHFTELIVGWRIVMWQWVSCVTLRFLAALHTVLASLSDLIHHPKYSKVSFHVYLCLVSFISFYLPICPLPELDLMILSCGSVVYPLPL